MAEDPKGGLLDLEKELSCSVGLYSHHFSMCVPMNFNRFAPKSYISHSRSLIAYIPFVVHASKNGSPGRRLLPSQILIPAHHVVQQCGKPDQMLQLPPCWRCTSRQIPARVEVSKRKKRPSKDITRGNKFCRNQKKGAMIVQMRRIEG